MKKKILILISHYLPGNKMGGPIQSIRSICEYLRNDFDIYVYTLNHDFGSNEPYDKIISDKWIKKDGISIYYSSPNQITFKNIKELLDQSFDKVYLNSFFEFKFSILPLIINKYFIREKKELLIAPRGEFNPGALALKKNKKSFYIKIARIINLYKKVIWHATSLEEKIEIQNLMKTENIIQVSNLKILKNIEKENSKIEDELKLVHISRISPKKNLNYLLNILKSMELSSNKKILLDIYGPIEDKIYWAKCLTNIYKMNKNIEINYKGILENDKVSQVISKYDFSIFPTLGENFGHVIIESFIGKTPVIVSDTTPWKNLKEKNIGYDLNLEKEEYWRTNILNLIEMENIEYNKMIESIQKFLEKDLKMNDEIEKMKQIFEGRF